MTKWIEMYNQKLTTPEDAVRKIPSGSLMCVPLANGQPPVLLNALAQAMVSGDLKNLTYISALDARFLDFHKPEIIQEAIKNNVLEVMYCGPISRHYVRQGIYPYVAHRMSEGPRIAAIRNMGAALITVSPMDKHGFFSLGTNPDYIFGMIRRNMPGCKIIAEVNENMPRTYGNNHFHISEIEALIEANTPLVALPEIPTSREDELIGQYIAEYVSDGSCIQLGIGSIPNAVAKHLFDKKDLGIHSEMLCDSMVDLYNAGVITGTRKTFMPRKWIASFAVGSQKLYDFINENPMVEMHDSEFVNDAYNIGLNDNVISINATLEVDLTGQCASEAIGTQQYSGAGGQMDFIEGAWRSKGGKAFLALYSTYTDKEGKVHSKISPTLAPGSMVTTTRNDVQYIVTEYGVVYLKGQNLRERVNALINIAHPDFRNYLRFEAKKLNYIL